MVVKHTAQIQNGEQSFCSTVWNVSIFVESEVEFATQWCLNMLLSKIDCTILWLSGQNVHHQQYVVLCQVHQVLHFFISAVPRKQQKQVIEPLDDLSYTASGFRALWITVYVYPF